MTYLVKHHLSLGIDQFVASSGGNAGYSLAYACKRLGAKVHVVVPTTTNARMQSMIAGEGATIEVFGASWIEAHAHAMGLAEENGAIYVPPFDDPLLWGGHSSMIDECAAMMEEPDVVIAAVGGGGLLCGIMEGMQRNGWHSAMFLAAETEGAASFAKSLEAGEVVSIASIDTIATSLGAKRVAEEAFNWSKSRLVKSHICSDRQAGSTST